MNHNFLSPDGITISQTDFESKNDAEIFLNEWII